MVCANDFTVQIVAPGTSIERCPTICLTGAYGNLQRD